MDQKLWLIFKDPKIFRLGGDLVYYCTQPVVTGDLINEIRDTFNNVTPNLKEVV